MPTRSSLRVRVGWLVGVSLWALAGALSGCGPRSSDAEHNAHPGEARGDHGEESGTPGDVHLSPEAVETSGIELGQVERRALSGGASLPAELSFDPLSIAHVAPLATGRFVSIEVQLGDQVVAGQRLAVVDSASASEASSQLSEARAQLSAAETALARQRQLVGQGIGAQSALVDAEAVVAGLRARSRGLARQLGVLGSGRGGQVRLNAPISGIVVQLHATPGETASTDEPAFTIADPDAISVYAQVPELSISRVRLDQITLFRPHAFPDLVLPGRVVYISPAIDTDTRSLSVRVALDSMDPRLLSGMYGSVEIVGDQLRSLSVPCDAVVTLNGATTVFVPGEEEGQYRAQAVRIGRRAGAFYELLGGLDEGAALVTSGAFTLKSAMSTAELSGHEH